jgi:hypothetical protein
MLPRKIVRHHCPHTPRSANSGDTWNARISVRKYQKFQRMHTRTEEFLYECKLRIKTGYPNNQQFEITTIPVAHIRHILLKPSCLFGNNNVAFSLLSYSPCNPPPQRIHGATHNDPASLSPSTTKDRHVWHLSSEDRRQNAPGTHASSVHMISERA